MNEVKPIHEIIEEISPYYKKKGGAEAEHTLVYDSATEQLEPIYFFILDLLESFGIETEKLVDNFGSSPGSGHFSELGQRATIMQQQGAKILGDVNTVLRSVLNIIYDLKEFKIRLYTYDDLKSEDKEKAKAAKLSLKQIWLDKVDMNKGNSSIKAMAFGQAGFQTLLDAFLMVDDVKQVKNVDLNDRIKRLVSSRISEFNAWLGHSEKELRKRYNLEKTYLKSQVNSLKLYSRWAKPYLRAASQLESKDFGRNPAMVKIFNTLLLELTLLGKAKFKVKDAALEGILPKEFASESFLKSVKRNYIPCILVDFKFRGIPQRVAQQSHFAFGGKAEVIFRSYCLNDDEIAKLEEELDKSDLSDVMGLVEGASEESLKEMQDEINYFLEEKDEEEKKIKKDSSNPFLALMGNYEKKSENKKDNSEKKEIIVKPDSWLEKEHLRKVVAETAEDLVFKLFDIYKKAHGMNSWT